jgi:hypothetical protein
VSILLPFTGGVKFASVAVRTPIRDLSLNCESIGGLTHRVACEQTHDTLDSGAWFRAEVFKKWLPLEVMDEAKKLVARLKEAEFKYPSDNEIVKARNTIPLIVAQTASTSNGQGTRLKTLLILVSIILEHERPFPSFDFGR